MSVKYPTDKITLGDLSKGEIEYYLPTDLTCDPTEYKNGLKYIKSIVRNSREYKNWVKYVHARYGPAICCVSGNVAAIEVHHHPLTMEDYVDIGLSWCKANSISTTPFIVADIIIRLHYLDQVPAAFVSSTYHERYHKFRDVTIPPSAIFGNYIELMNNPIIISAITPETLCKITTTFGLNS